MKKVVWMQVFFGGVRKGALFKAFLLFKVEQGSRDTILFWWAAAKMIHEKVKIHAEKVKIQVEAFFVFQVKKQCVHGEK